jgi:glucosamine-6-phosphate deaminase
MAQKLSLRNNVITMRILTFKNVNEVAEAVEKELRRLANMKSEALKIFLPTGNTPKPLYALFRKNSQYWKNHLDGIQIDEFIDPDRPFFKQLEREIVGPLGIRLSAWDPSFTNEMTFKHVKEVLSKPIDATLLGLGPNGHVGFHEPGITRNFEGGHQTVGEATRLRCGAKTADVLTFGVRAFIKAHTIFLVVTGHDKRDIFEKFKNSQPSESIPATLLKNHPNFQVFTDLA